MRKLATLLLAAGLVLGAATGAQAIDFKAKGEWLVDFNLGNGQNFMAKDRYGNKKTGNTFQSGHSPQDNFDARQRVRLQLDAVASEALSGTVYFEIGDQQWGKGSQGAALGADGTVVEVKQAYLDWIVPNTDLKLRMGIQGMKMPSFSYGSMVFDEDVAGIAASYKFNDNVSATLAWARAYNDNHVANDTNRWNAINSNYMDNVDAFALMVPVTLDGVKVTPWAMLGMIGPTVYRDALSGKYGNKWGGGYTNYGNTFTGNVVPGIAPAVVYDGGGHKKGPVSDYSTAFWAGITGELTLWDPFRLAWDFNYGGIYTGQEQWNKSGWMLNALAEYKMDWGTPGLMLWWSSGDDDNLKNGSEVMPNFGSNLTNTAGYVGWYGEPTIGNDGALGRVFNGTWGIGGRIKDMSFLENLKHTISLSYMQGTNAPAMAGYITGKKSYKGEASGSNYTRIRTDFNSSPGVYLTTMDSAMEFNLNNNYKIYENLETNLNFGYVAMWLDQSSSMWGPGYKYGISKANGGGGIGTTDAWNIDLNFRYAF